MHWFQPGVKPEQMESEYFLLQKHGKDTVDLELKIAQERLKAKNQESIKPIISRPVQELLGQKSDNSTELKGMQPGESGFNAQQYTKQIQDEAAEAKKKYNGP